MQDQVIDTFRQEFDRFHAFLELHIDVCPSDDIWREKTGNFAYWQHLMHAFSCVEFYAAPLGAPSLQTIYPESMARFKNTEEPQRPMTRDEMRSLATAVKKLANDFFATQSTETMPLKNDTMSKAMGKDCTNIQALIALIRHYNYHLGCCDAALRSHGLPGVY